jgi:hypothetical protein
MKFAAQWRYKMQDCELHAVTVLTFHEGGPRAEGCFVSDSVNFLLITSIIVSCDSGSRFVAW